MISKPHLQAHFQIFNVAENGPGDKAVITETCTYVMTNNLYGQTMLVYW